MLVFLLERAQAPVHVVEQRVDFALRLLQDWIIVLWRSRIALQSCSRLGTARAAGGRRRDVRNRTQMERVDQDVVQVTVFERMCGGCGIEPGAVEPFEDVEIR